MPNHKLDEETKNRKKRYQNETAAVREYLDSLSKKAMTEATRERRLSRIELALQGECTSVERLQLMQRRRDLLNAEVSNEEKEANFIKVASVFSERKGIEFATWREMGVPARVLRDAGIQH